MTDFGTSFRGAEEFSGFRDRVAAARAAALLAAEKYVQTRRQIEVTRHEARELRAQTAQLRHDLEDTVTSYVRAMRSTNVPPERAVVMVKSAVIESDCYPDNHQRDVVEEVVRWAVDAYYAA